MRQLLDHAAENNYGVPAFNVNNLEQIRAIMEGAKETNSPVVVCSECIAKIKPNIINAKPHKLLINNNQIIKISQSNCLLQFYNLAYLCRNKSSTNLPTYLSNIYIGYPILLVL